MVENYFEFHKLLEKEEEHTQANMVCNEESSIDSLTKKRSLTGFFVSAQWLYIRYIAIYIFSNSIKGK